MEDIHYVLGQKNNNFNELKSSLLKDLSANLASLAPACLAFCQTEREWVKIVIGGGGVMCNFLFCFNLFLEILFLLNS